MLLRSEQLAERLGIARRTVSDYARRGVLPSMRNDRGDYLFDLDEATRAYERHLAGKGGGAAGSDGAEIERYKRQGAKADAEIKMYRADLLRGELEEREARLYSAECVEEMMDGLVLYVRRTALSFPGRVGPALAESSDPAECAAILRDGVSEMLDELAEFEYSGEFFSERLGIDAPHLGEASDGA